MGTGYTANLEPADMECTSIPGLRNEKVLRFCQSNIEMMPSVAEGARIGFFECQVQFEGRRWNCSTIDGDESVFGNVLNIGSRETAFVNSILAAGLVHSISRSCARGDHLSCGCDRRHKGPQLGSDLEIVPNDTWHWGGCSEDVRYGVRFSRDFLIPQDLTYRARGQMNRHNNEAGRQVVLNNMELKCKCHGISGSCELKTCWWQMASFRKLGNILKVKYDSAAEMAVKVMREHRANKEVLEPRYSHFKDPTLDDLIYFERSPDYCQYNPSVGSLGTVGRECNLTSHGIDGCELLCCGRGHNTQTVIRDDRCDCRFVWCCDVVCRKCQISYELYTCK
ncbi:Wnt3 [Apostichopus japonicus]|uniref:Protein Wnt n=1 Tax=Stichopus japonicus TaxID=307972 RepID=A0A2G8KCB5_STIJA|nr:Wnt3 [Apostichopus japonicus]